MKWATYPKTPMIKVTQYEFKFQTKFEFKQRRRKIKQKKKRKEGKKAHSRLGLLGPPVRSSRLAPLVHTTAGRPNSCGQPSKQPGTLLMPTRLPASLVAAATRAPRVSHSQPQDRLPPHANSFSDQAPTRVAGAGQGSRWEHDPVSPLAPRPRPRHGPRTLAQPC